MDVRSDRVVRLRPGQLFGQYLKIARLGVGMSQEELAAKVGKEQWAVSQLERGRNVMMPDPDVVLDVLRAVGADPAEALAYVGYLPQEGDEAGNITDREPAELFAAMSRMVELADGLPEDARDIMRRAIDYARTVAEAESGK